MNELIFFGHIALLIGFTFFALRIGKHALFSLCAIEILLANLFVTKQITLFSFSVTPTDAYIIGSLLASNLLQEYFGKEEAKKLVNLNLLMLVFFTAMALVQIIYIPSSHDGMHSAFSAILSPSPRIFIASLICFYATVKLDIEFFGFLRKRFSLTGSMAISLVTTQAFDTIAFSMLGLYGMVYSLTTVMLVSYLMKMITISAMVPFTRLIWRKVA